MKKLILYHGTDERLLRMSEEERQAYFKALDTAMDYVYKAFKDLNFCSCSSIDGIREIVKSLHMELGDEPLLELYSALTVTGGWIAGCPFLIFRKLCATNSRERAVGYARASFAGGDLAAKTYYLIEMAEYLRLPGYDPQGEAKAAIETVKDFADEKKAMPVLVRFEICDPDQLEHQGGEEVDQTQFDVWCNASCPFDVCVRKNISEGEIERLQSETENNNNKKTEDKKMKNIEVKWVKRLGENVYKEDPDSIVALGGEYNGQKWEMTLEAVGSAIVNNVYSFYIKIFNEDLPLIPVMNDYGTIYDLKTPKDVGALKLLRLLPSKADYYQC